MAEAVAGRPIVLLPCDVKAVGASPYHVVGEKYIDAAAHGCDAVPLLLPGFGAGQELEALTGHVDLEALLAGVDGVLLPGSVSNVHPARYRDQTPPANPDPQRDETAFALIRAAWDQDVPILAICRGLQELNVALGGTLHAAIHGLPGHLDHREDPARPREAQYAPAHAVAVRPGGMLARQLDVGEFQVNSLHGQGIRDLAAPLAIEATAPDGVIEAVSAPGHTGFVLGVQWHPEWGWRDDPQSRALFGAFGAAIAARQRARSAR